MTTTLPTAKISPRTVADAVKLLPTTSYFDYHRNTRYSFGKLSTTDNLRLFIDNHDTDCRSIVEVTIHSWGLSRVETKYLYGYDSDRERWTIEGGTTQREYENRRGVKALRTAVDDIFQAWGSYRSHGKATGFTAYRNRYGKAWEVY